MIAGVSAFQLKGKRPVQEDVIRIEDTEALLKFLGTTGANCQLVSVFDGHAGKRAATFLSQNLHQYILSRLCQLPSWDTGSSKGYHSVTSQSIREVLREAYLHMDAVFLQNARNGGWNDGSTSLTCLVLGSRMFLANLGDCRGVMYEGGKSKQLTTDHKPNLPEERARIESEGGSVKFSHVPRVAGIGLAVSRSIGDLSGKEPRPLLIAEPTVTKVNVDPAKHKYVVLASDGLWDVLPSSLAINELRQPRENDAQHLCLRAYRLGSQDNISAIVIRFQTKDKSSKSQRTPHRRIRTHA